MRLNATDCGSRRMSVASLGLKTVHRFGACRAMPVHFMEFSGTACDAG